MRKQLTIIDSDNYAASGVECLVFPGGEPHVKIPEIKGDVLLHLKLRKWKDVGFAAMVSSAVEQQQTRHALDDNTGVMDEPQETYYCFIPYFPGARQDRSDGRAPLTVDVMKNILFNHWPAHTAVFDAHSSETLRGLGHGVKNFLPADISYWPIKRDVVGIIAPDEGALVRVKNYRDRLYPNTTLLTGMKKRNPQTGALSGYKLDLFDTPFAQGRYIVVDDICDGGGTFNLLANEIRSHERFNGCTFELHVSHGIFSKGLQNIDPIYEQIVTTDSWCRRKTNSRLTVVPLLPFISGVLGNA